MNKAHGCDQLSIRIIKVYGNSIFLPLKLIFKSIINEGDFPKIRSRVMLLQVIKKSKENLIIGLSVSLLPIFIKDFERLVFNALFNFFLQNKPFTPCQSGFILGDSCVSQLLSVAYEIYQSFNCHPHTDIKGTFLDISKAIDKVWHKSLIFKLKTYGIDGKLLKLLENYLPDRQQRVVLNGQTSSWENMCAGVPQDSVLGPILFLIYINDWPDGLTSMCNIFAADISSFSKVNDKSISNAELNSDLAKISKCAFQWKMSFNPDPNKQVIEVRFANKRDEGN